MMSAYLITYLGSIVTCPAGVSGADSAAGVASFRSNHSVVHPLVWQACRQSDGGAPVWRFLTDVAPFITALLDPSEYEKRYPDCELEFADVNADGFVDLTDVESFIELLLG